MAAPKGQLFDGTKKKIINKLSSDGCDIKTTASLCKEFPILWYHEEFVNQMADMFKLERTVREFSKNRVAAKSDAPPPPRSPEQDDAAAEAEEAAANASEHEDAVVSTPAPAAPSRPAATPAAPIVEPIDVGSPKRAASQALSAPALPRPPAKKPRSAMTVPERLLALESDVDEFKRGLLSTQSLLRRHDGICNHYWALQKTIEKAPVLRDHLTEFFDNPTYQSRGLEGLHSLARKAQDQEHRFLDRQHRRDVNDELSRMDDGTAGKSSNLH